MVMECSRTEGYERKFAAGCGKSAGGGAGRERSSPRWSARGSSWCGRRASSFSSAILSTRRKRARCSLRRPAFARRIAARCVDVEGGTVNRLRDALAPMPSAQAVAQAMRREGSRNRTWRCERAEHGELIARESVKAFGFNTTLAPVVDLALPESREVLGSRRCRSERGRSDRMRASFLQGSAAQGVAGCGKHFPGLGGAHRRFAFCDSGD